MLVLNDPSAGQCASAFHFFSSSINLKPDFPSSYMYLAITLAKLDDFDNACSAYEKAIDMESDHLFHLNYAVTLFNASEVGRCCFTVSYFSFVFYQSRSRFKELSCKISLC